LRIRNVGNETTRRVFSLAILIERCLFMAGNLNAAKWFSPYKAKGVAIDKAGGEEAMLAINC